MKRRCIGAIVLISFVAIVGCAWLWYETRSLAGVAVFVSLMAIASLAGGMTWYGTALGEIMGAIDKASDDPQWAGWTLRDNAWFARKQKNLIESVARELSPGRVPTAEMAELRHRLEASYARSQKYGKWFWRIAGPALALALLGKTAIHIARGCGL